MSVTLTQIRGDLKSADGPLDDALVQVVLKDDADNG